MTDEPGPVCRIVARNVRDLRNARGWSARELSERCTAAGTSIERSVLANLENGRRASVTVDELDTLATVFGVLTHELLAEPKPRKPVNVGTGMPETSHLEAFGESLRDAFGVMPYHVGSSIQGKTWRDVDVRIMLDDDRFGALFPGYGTWRQRDAWWSLVCAGISELGRVRTGLPVDFQVQRTSEANAMFDGPRNPLFINRAEDDHRPEMRAGDATLEGRDDA